MRHRLLVAAPSTADVVRCAGGWLFDQVMAGWEVTVLIGDNADPRPLRILGAGAGELEPALASLPVRPQLQAIAACAELVRSDPRVRQLVLDGLRKGLAEVTLWGEECPADLDGAVCPVRYRLSAAARAFKAQALAAAAAPSDACDVTEVFRKGEVKRPSPVPVR